MEFFPLQSFNSLLDGYFFYVFVVVCCLFTRINLLILQGSYYCDFCMSGYIGTLRTGCVLDNFCISGAHDCNSGANCIYLGPALYRCEVGETV